MVNYKASVTLEQTKDGREQVYRAYLPITDTPPLIYDYMAGVHNRLGWKLSLTNKKDKYRKKMNDEVIYRATFTLEQHGLEGEVRPNLEFFPKIDDPTQAPPIYGYMSNELLKFLRMVHIIDDNNEIIDQSYLDSVELHLTDEDNGETRQ